MMKNYRYIYLLILFVVMAAAQGAIAGERVAIKGSLANVRALPSTKSDTLWQVEKYHPFSVIKKKGKWYHLKDFEGDTGWVHSNLVDKTPTVIVKVKLANIRTGPGTQHDLSFDAGKGTPFKVLETKDKWLKVQHGDGDMGWIFKPLTW